MRSAPATPAVDDVLPSPGCPLRAGAAVGGVPSLRPPPGRTSRENEKMLLLLKGLSRSTALRTSEDKPGLASGVKKMKGKTR